MHTSSSVSLCRHCQYYLPEGRRGGYCQKLSVSVKSRWKACSLATPPFPSAWDPIESITAWKNQLLASEGIILSMEGTLSSDLFEVEALDPSISFPTSLP